MKRYELLFEKSFLEKPIRGRIIELGDEKDLFEPFITLNCFAYKIFYSDKTIDELRRPFELPEYIKEKTIYFGKAYSVEEYLKRFPKNAIDEQAIITPDVFNIIQASPVGVPFAFPLTVYKNANIEIIDYLQARKVSVSANSEIVKNHKSVYAF